MSRKKPWRCSSNSGIFHRWDHIFSMELFSTWSADLPYTDIFHLCRCLLIWLIENPYTDRYLWLRTKDLQHSCQFVSHSTRQHASHVVHYLLFWSLRFTFTCFFFIFFPPRLLFLQLCVRIEKNPGLGFSISGGISGQGNPFKPSDMVRPDQACQPITVCPAYLRVAMETAARYCSVLSFCLYVCLSVGRQLTLSL